jgi:hypothetical protein
MMGGERGLRSGRIRGSRGYVLVPLDLIDVGTPIPP